MSDDATDPPTVHMYGTKVANGPAGYYSDCSCGYVGARTATVEETFAEVEAHARRAVDNENVRAAPRCQATGCAEPAILRARKLAPNDEAEYLRLCESSYQELYGTGIVGQRETL